MSIVDGPSVSTLTDHTAMRQGPSVSTLTDHTAMRQGPSVSTLICQHAPSKPISHIIVRYGST